MRNLSGQIVLKSNDVSGSFTGNLLTAKTLIIHHQLLSDYKPNNLDLDSAVHDTLGCTGKEKT